MFNYLIAVITIGCVGIWNVDTVEAEPKSCKSSNDSNPDISFSYTYAGEKIKFILKDCVLTEITEYSSEEPDLKSSKAKYPLDKIHFSKGDGLFISCNNDDTCSSANVEFKDENKPAKTFPRLASQVFGYSGRNSVGGLAVFFDKVMLIANTRCNSITIDSELEPFQQKNIGWKIKAAHNYADGENGWTISCDDGNTRTVFYAKSPSLSYAPYGGKHTSIKYFSTLDEAAKYSCNGE
jgi:hypothetical protein